MRFRLLHCLRASFAALAVAIGCVSPAAASGRERDRDDRLTYEISGYIAPRCAVRQSSHTGAFGDVLDPRTGRARAATLELPVEIDCNGPFAVELTSERGGLGYDGVNATTDRDFTTLVGYEAQLRVGGRAGARACTSAAMAKGKAVVGAARQGCRRLVKFDPQASAASALELRVTPSAQLLLAGAYTDFVTIRVTPVLGGEE